MDTEQEDERSAAKKAVDAVNPFAVVSKAIKNEKPKPEGLAKGRTTAIFQANVRKLQSKGLSEAEATKRAQRFMMEH